MSHLLNLEGKGEKQEPVIQILQQIKSQKSVRQYQKGERMKKNPIIKGPGMVGDTSSRQSNYIVLYVHANVAASIKSVPSAIGAVHGSQYKTQVD